VGEKRLVHGQIRETSQGQQREKIKQNDPARGEQAALSPSSGKRKNSRKTRVGRGRKEKGGTA